jgi:hypothetical protein
MTTYGPRTRELDESLPAYTNTLTGIREQDGYSPTQYLNWSVGVASQLDKKVTKDVVDEKFHERRAAGEIFNNPFASTTTKGGRCVPTRFIYNYWTPGNTTFWGFKYDGMQSAQDILPGYLALEPKDYSDMYESVRDKAVTMAYGNRSLAVQAVSMTLAEGKKTVQGAYEILFRLAELALAFKRLDVKHLMDEISPTELRNRYMELRYAIRPLMIDAENIVKAVNTDLGKSRKTARGGSDERVVISDTQTGSKIYDFPHFNWTAERTSTYIVEARAGVLCDVNQTKLNTFGIDQIAETVWEVIPFSFIFGWFFNFADLISSWTPKAGVKELASWVTIVETLVQEVRLTDVTFGAMTENENVYWSGSKTLTTQVKTRIPNPARSVWPQIDVSLDSLKIIDLTIILSGILSGKITKFYR